MKYIYIAGKITGLTIDEVYTNFHKAVEFINSIDGYTAISPNAFINIGDDYEEIMKKCLSIAEGCDGIYLMKNWTDSKGAIRELEHMLSLEDKTIVVDDNNIDSISKFIEINEINYAERRELTGTGM